MQHNLSLYKKTTGQNWAKLLEIFIYISYTIPWNSQANESNFEKIDLWWISHANGNTKISYVETLVAKEPELVILGFWHKHKQRYKLWNFWPYEAHCANKYAKKEEKEKNTTNLAIYYGTLLATTVIIYETMYFYKTNC